MNEESTEILIPKKRFDEVNEKLKALREENKALTEANQRLQKFESDFAEAKTTLDLKEIFVEDLMSQQGRKNRFGEGNRKNQTTGNLGGKNNGN